MKVKRISTRLTEASSFTASKEFWAEAKESILDAKNFHLAYDEELNKLDDKIIDGVFKSDGLLVHKGTYGAIKELNTKNPDSWAAKALMKFWVLQFKDAKRIIDAEDLFKSKIKASSETPVEEDIYETNMTACLLQGDVLAARLDAILQAKSPDYNRVKKAVPDFKPQFSTIGEKSPWAIAPGTLYFSYSAEGSKYYELYSKIIERVSAINSFLYVETAFGMSRRDYILKYGYRADGTSAFTNEDLNKLADKALARLSELVFIRVNVVYQLEAVYNTFTKLKAEILYYKVEDYYIVKIVNNKSSIKATIHNWKGKLLGDISEKKEVLNKLVDNELKKESKLICYQSETQHETGRCYYENSYYMFFSSKDFGKEALKEFGYTECSSDYSPCGTEFYIRDNKPGSAMYSEIPAKLGLDKCGRFRDWCDSSD